MKHEEIKKQIKSIYDKKKCLFIYDAIVDINLNFGQKIEKF